MDEQPNPYEPPQVPAEPIEPTEANPSPNAGGWWFVGLALVTLCGLLSWVPGVAVLFLVLSAPVYIRYLRVFQGKKMLERRKPLPLILQILASAAFVVGVAAASAGAFLGTCSVAVWPAAMAMTAVVNHYDPGIQYGLYIAVGCGIAAFLAVANWLIRRKWDTPPSEAPEKSL